MTDLTLQDRFRGCILGGLLGDVIGAPVEGEMPGYLVKQFGSIDTILAMGTVEEAFGPPWTVGHFTDDTQTTIGVAEWLLADAPPTGETLLERFCANFEPWRRYGSGTEWILDLFPENRSNWTQLSRAMFPDGSFGNGSAMRVAPIALLHHNDFPALVKLTMESSRTTHSHPLAIQGALLQALAIATVLRRPEIQPGAFLQTLRLGLVEMERRGQNTAKFHAAVERLKLALREGWDARQFSHENGCGITALEAVPMALFCFLRNPESFERALHDAIFVGGDTDAIGSMTGALSGAHLGVASIPPRWLRAVREEAHCISWLEQLADTLYTTTINPEAA